MSLPPLDELQWKSPEWIQSFGLHTDNVLDYFAQSPFFDRTSNNQVVKMQQQFSQQPIQQQQLHQQLQQQLNQQHQDSGPAVVPRERAHIWNRYPSHALLEKELMKLKGIEYILVLVREPDLWVIRKQRREQNNTVIPLRYYYVIGSSVYQSPTLFKTMHSRLLSTNYHLSNALCQLNALVQFHPSQGASFLRPPTTVPESTTSDTVAPTTTTTTTANAATTATTAATTSTTATTATATTTVAPATAATATIAAPDPDGWKDTINLEVTDKLITASIKSKPVYI